MLLIYQSSRKSLRFLCCGFARIRKVDVGLSEGGKKFTRLLTSSKKLNTSLNYKLKSVSENKESESNTRQEKPDSWWYRVYIAALIFTALFITTLWIFERVFSS